MAKTENSKPYDLGERTLKFAKRTSNYVKNLPRNLSNIEYAKQLIRSSGSIGANYIEAEEALSKKDFLHRMKITRKECKEATYWLELLKEANPKFTEETNDFIKESQELRSIFTSIIDKSK